VVAVELPKDITPFTLTTLLRRIRRTDDLSPADREALDRTLADLERRYFAEGDGNGEIDLKALALDWAQKAKPTKK
jgi:hypothetical protein